jgi:two-component sensor histidine kinase
VIDYFAPQDIERDGETLPQWLARKHGESVAEARARLSTMAHVHGRLMDEEESEEGRAAA